MTDQPPRIRLHDVQVDGVTDPDAVLDAITRAVTSAIESGGRRPTTRDVMPKVRDEVKQEVSAPKPSRLGDDRSTPDSR